MMPVKVCGITNLEDALCCIEHGVSALGFIFADSKRRVMPETVYQISRKLPLFITKIGVFVNEDPLIIKEILKECRLDLAQLHGEESPATADVLAGRAIKTFRAGYDLPDPTWAEAPLKAILIDTYSPEAAGGTGTVFDWNCFRQYRQLGFPMILAGGLNSANIHQAIQITLPDAIDLSSGVERVPGKKDRQKVKSLMAEMKKY